MAQKTNMSDQHSSGQVLLEFMYRMESGQTQALAHLLQRLAIIVAANAALMGLWANLLVMLRPSLMTSRAATGIWQALFFGPLVILGVSVAFAAIAMRYRSFKSVDPKQMGAFYHRSEQATVEELVGSYINNWSDNQPKVNDRAKYFNISLWFLTFGFVWMLAMVLASFFYV